MRHYARVLTMLMLSCVPAIPAEPQTPPAAGKMDGPAFRIFLRRAAWLDRKAAERTRAGKSTSLSTVHMNAANLTEEQNRLFLEEVREFLRKVDALDTRARQIIEEAHRKYPNGYLLPGQPIPPPPPELNELQSQKERLTEDTIQRLHDRLGPEAFQRLQQYAEAKVAPHLKRTNLVIPSAGR
jgi:hypothetical protein